MRYFSSPKAAIATAIVPYFLGLVTTKAADFLRRLQYPEQHFDGGGGAPVLGQSNNSPQNLPPQKPLKDKLQELRQNNLDNEIRVEGGGGSPTFGNK